MIDFKKNKIPLFFHIPKSAGSYIRSRLWRVFMDEIEDRKNAKNIIVTSKEGNEIFRFSVSDTDNITKDNSFKKDLYYDESVFVIDFESLKKLNLKKVVNVFDASVLAEGFGMWQEFEKLIKNIAKKDTLRFTVLRDPLQREMSLYNYIVVDQPKYEKNNYKIREKSFKEYAFSERMSDSWLLRNLVDVNGEISDKHLDEALDILNGFDVYDIINVEKCIKKTIKKCYNLDVKTTHNSAVFRNKSKTEKQTDFDKKFLTFFYKKKKYDYALYNKYKDKTTQNRFFSKEIKNVKKEECFFCHKENIAGENIDGSWDVSGCVEEYLGDVNFKNKRVLDVGAGSGFWSFHVEKMGAEVVSHEIPDGSYWDMFKHPNSLSVDKKFNQGILNGYWYCHKKNKSKNKLLLWDVYKDLPDEIGEFDITIFSMVLSHFRDPFLALMNLLYKTKEKAILVNTFSSQESTTGFFYGEEGLWWELSKECTHCFMEKIGFRLIQENIINPYNTEEEETKEYKCLVFERY